MDWAALGLPPEVERWDSEGGRMPPTIPRSAGGNNPHKDGRLNANVAVSDALPIGVLITDVYGNCVYSNAAYERLSGRKQAHLLGSHWVSFVYPEDRVGLVRDCQEAMLQRRPFVAEMRLVRTDGSQVWVRQTITAVNETSLEYGHAHILEDISTTREDAARQRVEHRNLSEEVSRARRTLDCIGDAVICTDISQKITFMNSMAEHLTGWTRAKALGQPLIDVFRVVDAQTGKPMASRAEQAIGLQCAIESSADNLLLAGDGGEKAIQESAAPIYNHRDELTGAVIVFHATPLSPKHTERPTQRTEHDSLTGLPNRSALNERYIQAQALARRHNKQVAVLFIDLDNFKQVNDHLGQESGDRLLINVVSELQACVRTTDTVCRYGNDEFVIMLSEIEQPGHASHVVDKLHAAIAQIDQHDGQTVTLSMTIGIGIFPDQGVTLNDLVRKASASMHRVEASSDRSGFAAP